MKTKLIFLTIIIFATETVNSQIMFQRHFGGDNVDQGTCVLQTDDGGYLVAGQTYSFGLSSGVIYLIRTDEYGDTLWTKTIGNNEPMVPSAMISTNDNNYIIAGQKGFLEGSYTNYDVLLMKINQSGDIIWTKTYGGPADDYGRDIIQTNDNGFIIVGETVSFSPVVSSIWVIKTDEYGDTLWTKTYEKKNTNTAQSVVQTSDGGYFIAGKCFTNGYSDADYILIKTNSTGDTLWTKTSGNPSIYASSCHETSNGNLFICGVKWNDGTGWDLFLSKLNSSGDTLWRKIYGGINVEGGGKFIQTNDNGFVIVGYTESFGAGNYDVYLIKTDTSGNVIWEKTYGDHGDDLGGRIQQTFDNGYIIVGLTNSFGNNYDIFLIKTSSDGVAGFEQVYQIASDCKVYPNPSDGLINIEFKEQHTGKINIRVFDIMGKLVIEKNISYINGNMLQLSLPNLSNGMYYLQISEEKINTVKKILIQK